MFMTAKLNIKKLVIAAVAAVAVIIGIVLLFGGSRDAADTVATGVSGNDARVEFLRSFGWEVAASPVESGQVKIPKTPSDVYERYNLLQKSQGYDLTGYAGKNVMRYVYQVQNYPGATEPVYATLLIYQNQVIGGDVTDTAAKGTVSGFQKPGIAEQTPVTQPAQE